MNIFRRIRQHFENHRKAEEAEDFSRGYDFAAGALLRGEETPFTLVAKIWTRDSFDDGILKAIDRLVSAGIVIDDRI
jgi:hypothetical protein